MNKVLFFAHLKDAIGEESVMMEAKGLMVAELKQKLKSQYNIQSLDVVMTAINEEFASDEELIQDGDVIAFIPPVSGG
ncbi:molybdopterin converting factor subunit 1 [Cytobacillus spongiae]|jgi:molybdopterin synthase sulfur carrier subunit|uniref:molybdopterin converting factor subunit 1 n=1 Tax=Cytobacillus spongiae TaxID=2901381 RepID=UPI001F28A5A3|nr:molybdopterin converting factor subunit 1 [Cytobacillus spongiae]UII55806.1 molybdopterin converting factor subunit 1 [Cytobacillus spongiae]